MAEEDDVLDDAEALEEAMTSDDGDGDGEELDPLAEEMLKMMEEDQFWKMRCMLLTFLDS